MLDASERSSVEVRSGSLTCASCGHVASVSRGVVDLMPDPPDFVRREALGLERFADTMRADGWDRERILRLPDDPLEYWQGQKAAMEHLLATVELRPGSTLLDVGSNTCWASNVFASRGLDVVLCERDDLPFSKGWNNQKDAVTPDTARAFGGQLAGAMHRWLAEPPAAER